MSRDKSSLIPFENLFVLSTIGVIGNPLRVCEGDWVNEDDCEPVTVTERVCELDWDVDNVSVEDCESVAIWLPDWVGVKVNDGDRDGVKDCVFEEDDDGEDFWLGEFDVVTLREPDDEALILELRLLDASCEEVPEFDELPDADIDNDCETDALWEGVAVRVRPLVTEEVRDTLGVVD